MKRGDISPPILSARDLEHLAFLGGGGTGWRRVDISQKKGAFLARKRLFLGCLPQLKKGGRLICSGSHILMSLTIIFLRDSSFSP